MNTRYNRKTRLLFPIPQYSWCPVFTLAPRTSPWVVALARAACTMVWAQSLWWTGIVLGATRENVTAHSRTRRDGGRWI